MKTRPISIAIASAASLFLCQCNEEVAEENEPGKQKPKEEKQSPASDKSAVPNVVSAVRGRAFEMKNLNVLKQLSLAAAVYSTESDGLYPRDYETLLKAADFAGEVTLSDPNTGKQDVKPLYFPGFSGSSPGKTILIACPFKNVDGTRTVAFVDTSVRKISDEEYQAQIAKQKQ